jgi:CRISPR/Cas system-associated protein Cas10 (large subunit of type III CRISPR-Cas system)
MGHFTDNPVADATSHIQDQDARPYDYDYTCDACREGFDHGHGIEITDEKFCSHCVDHNEHLEFYRNCGLTHFEIYEAVGTAKNL